jgi:hypothetical protein
MMQINSCGRIILSNSRSDIKPFALERNQNLIIFTRNFADMVRLPEPLFVHADEQ